MHQQSQLMPHCILTPKKQAHSPQKQRAGLGAKPFCGSLGTLGYPKPCSPERLWCDRWRDASQGAQALCSCPKVWLAVSCPARQLSPEFCPSEIMRFPRTKVQGRMPQAHSNTRGRKTHRSHLASSSSLFKREQFPLHNVFPQGFCFSFIPSCLEARYPPRLLFSCI